MTKEEMLFAGEWIKDSFVLKIESEIFNKIIPIEVSFDRGEERLLSDRSINAINDFLSFDKNNLAEIEEEIWKHCLNCNQTQNSRGSIDGGKTWVDTSSTLEQNLAEYGIKTKEDALQKSSIECVYLANTWGKNAFGRIFYLVIKVAWDNEHGMSIVYRNGKIDDVE